jgi:putative DNA methylase
MLKAPKKLIEVALPLDDINAASSREKSIRHGHPSTLHLWWARRPLAAARAVLFSQMVNDPGYERSLGRGVNKEKAEEEREKLFEILRELVQWENTNNEDVLSRAREEIMKSWKETCALNRDHPQAKELFDPETLPAFHDPFAGGGAIPLEAQRLGLESWASDLNPVAVLINKAMIEIPPRFANQRPVGPVPKKEQTGESITDPDWSGAKGLAEDVRRYGHWMREEAERRIGTLYPKIEITQEMAKERPDLKTLIGKELTVIAWLWARTVKSPNPAYSHLDVPLVSSFHLSTKKGKEAWVEPVIRPDGSGYDFVVRTSGKLTLEETINRKGGVCLMSGTPMDFKYLRAEGKAGRMGSRLMAIVAEGERGRVYLSPNEYQVKIAYGATPEWKPEMILPTNPRDFKTPNYGMKTYGDLFTPRQLVALTTFSDLVGEAIEKCRQDAIRKGLPDDGVGVDSGGKGATAYAQAVGVYLGLGVDRLADRSSTICSWDTGYTKIRNTFGRQAIPMTWDFCEGNVFSESTGNFYSLLEWVYKFLRDRYPINTGISIQEDAANQSISSLKIISTDPPYYDNIGYADLSDFFYVWLRRSLKSIFPTLFSTLAVPKTEELIASPYRHENKQEAEKFFLSGMTEAMHRLAEQAHPAFPVTIYYAFKQSDTKEGSTSSTGWETFLEAVLRAGFSITGTWPMRTELSNRMIGSGTNALASSIVLVCRKREGDVSPLSRREFLRELKDTLPEALEVMIGGAEGQSPIAPVDLAQSAIGPGMAIFSRQPVLEADGSPMPVHEALKIINKELDAYFSHAEGALDPDTLFCLSWFEGNGWGEGLFGSADTLSRAKGTSVERMKESGILESRGGKVRLLKFSEYPSDWNPSSDPRVSAWKGLYHLVKAFQESEDKAGSLLSAMRDHADAIRQLAYRIYTFCERKGWAEEARVVNELISSWHGVVHSSERSGSPKKEQKLKGLSAPDEDE